MFLGFRGCFLTWNLQISELFGGYIPISPRVLAPLEVTHTSHSLVSLLCLTYFYNTNNSFRRTKNIRVWSFLGLEFTELIWWNRAKFISKRTVFTDFPPCWSRRCTSNSSAEFQSVSVIVWYYTLFGALANSLQESLLPPLTSNSRNTLIWMNKSQWNHMAELGFSSCRNYQHNHCQHSRTPPPGTPLVTTVIADELSISSSGWWRTRTTV